MFLQLSALLSHQLNGKLVAGPGGLSGSFAVEEENDFDQGTPLRLTHFNYHCKLSTHALTSFKNFPFPPLSLSFIPSTGA
jgi:hypothetical protein